MPFTSWKEHREGSAVTYNEGAECTVTVKEHPDGSDPFFRLNEMCEADLLKIKGIGPKTAQKILAQLPVTSLDEMTLSKSAKTTLQLWLSK